MKAASKSAKPTTSKRLTREPIIGRATRSAAGFTFAIELVSFTINGEPLEPGQAAADLADTLLWVIGQKRADIAEANGNANPNP